MSESNVVGLDGQQLPAAEVRRRATEQRTELDELVRAAREQQRRDRAVRFDDYVRSRGGVIGL